jgi:hypothetical protein
MVLLLRLCLLIASRRSAGWVNAIGINRSIPLLAAAVDDTEPL